MALAAEPTGMSGALPPKGAAARETFRVTLLRRPLP